MRLPTKKIASAAWLGLALIAAIPLQAIAQLEEVIVTATRRETSLQDTPISVAAFSAEDLSLGGIEAGRDLGIMVPNVVLNPSTGGGQAQFYVRGLPGVGIYVDGVWQGGFGFQQTNFVEMERVEVLRGPQGTLFGRNTNGGAVNMTTRLPGDEFGARVNLDIGEFNRRNATMAVDLPITDRLKTKFMGATLQNDGFLQGVTVPWSFGSQDDTIVRADVLWEPTDSFSLRFTANDEEKRGTDPRIHGMTRYQNSKVLAYNVAVGAFQEEADAACAADAGCAAANPNGWPAPPGNVGTRFTGETVGEFTPASHTTNFPGDAQFGPAQLGKWETRSDSARDGITADVRYYTLTADWDVTPNMNFEAILSTWEADQRQVIDFDGTEFIVTTDDINDRQENETIELHLSGSTPNGRISWLGGYYSLEESFERRFYRWGMWDFVVPNTGPGDPALNVPLNEYVRDTAYLLGLNGSTIPGVPSGGNMLTPDVCLNAAGNPLPPGSFPYNRCRYEWNFYFISDDSLSRDFDEDEAFFGEATFSVTDRLDITVGARRSDKSGRETSLTPIDAFRTPDPDIRPQGEMFAGVDPEVEIDPDLPKTDTYKLGLQYEFTDDLMLYASYAEGFTSGGIDIITIGEAGVVPPNAVRFDEDQALITLEPEVIETKELGLRSDWLGGRLRFNATYFDSRWNNMRVLQLPRDTAGNTQPFPYNSDQGSGTADGFEFEVIYLPTDRLTLNFGLGLINTNYIQAGLFDGVTGNFPGSPFAYAADNSGTVGVNYDIPLSNGGHIMLVGNYGYMDDYSTDAAYQRIRVDENGDPILEPGYGILNARLVYEPADRNYGISVWGTNLTDEQYVNGGFDTRDIWGYFFSVIGRSREMGVSLDFRF